MNEGYQIATRNPAAGSAYTYVVYINIIIRVAVSVAKQFILRLSSRSFLIPKHNNTKPTETALPISVVHKLYSLYAHLSFHKSSCC